MQAVGAREADALVAARRTVPALRVVEGEELADAAALEQEKVGEPPQVDIYGAALPHAVFEVYVASEREAAHDVAQSAESTRFVARAEVEGVVEFAPRIARRHFGLVARREVLARTESVDHVGRVEFFAVETPADQQGVLVVQRGVVVRGYEGPAAHAPVVVASREINARFDPAQVVRVAAPDVEVALLHQQRRVLFDHVALGFDVAVCKAYLVVRRFEELFAQPHVERRVVEVAPSADLGGVEGPEQVGDFVFDHVAAVGEVLAAEVGHKFEFVARSEDVGVGKPHHRPALGMPSSVDGDGPAVARGDQEVHACRVHRVGEHRDVDVRDVVARADQLLVAHDELRVELVARAEQQVAPDDAVAGEHVGFVGHAFEPVAAGVENLLAFDGDVADGFPGVGFQQAALVGDAAAHRGVEHGFYEEHPVKHARHGAPAGFRLDAVVEALVARRCIGIRHAGTVGREPVGGVRAGSCGTDREDRCRPNQDQGKYAEPGEHCVKDNGFFRQKVRHRGLN